MNHFKDLSREVQTNSTGVRYIEDMFVGTSIILLQPCVGRPGDRFLASDPEFLLTFHQHYTIKWWYTIM